MWPKRIGRASVWRSFAIIAASAFLPIGLHAADADLAPKQAGEDRWVPSVAFTAGILIQQDHKGTGASFIREGTNPNFTPLRDPVTGNESAVSAFVGGSFELMSPALSIPTRPRIFIGGDILPNFAPGRDVALQGDPDCVRGPEPDSPCARDEDGTRRIPFGETAANGTGTQVEARVGSMVYGAHIGIAFPFEIAERQLRIKPSLGWINYKVSGFGLVVDAACDPTTVCTDFTNLVGFVIPGFLRETRISARDSQRFNGIGPGLELEMDTGQYGQLGVSIFMGAKAYVILDDRTISFKSGETFNDQVGNDEVLGKFTVRIDKWMYRAHIGVRVQFIGL